MNDLISRQAAIDALDGEIKLKDSDDVDSVARYIQQVARKINELPSAEKKGKWIDKDSAEWYCSECGAQAPFFWMSEIQRKSNYCYNCGADMRGEQDDSLSD